jgi:predicted permease
MLGVLTGFGIIGIVIAIGYGVARLRVLPDNALPVLNRLAFSVSTPALLFTVVSRSHPSEVFSPALLASVIAVVVTGALYVVVSVVFFRRGVGVTAVGTGASAYVNANNIGLPVATYVLGQPSLVVPIILLQLVVMAPIILTVLDITSRGEVSLRSVLTQPVRNPIIIASLSGLVVSLFGWTVPDILLQPLLLIGGSAVPLVLLGFGMSLVGRRPLQPGPDRVAVIVASAFKSLVMPIVAYLAGALLIGLSGPDLFAVVALASLPTAQNIYNYAARYQTGVVLARDTVLVTTIAAVPVLLLASVLLAH